MRVLVATKNTGKVAEFDAMLGQPDATADPTADNPPRRLALTFEPLPAGAPDVAETGDTFTQNAVIKAAAYARFYDRPAFADDSGLEVDALAGAPGVYSARYAELANAGSGDEANNALLLNQLTDVPDEDRTACFVCVLALCDAQGRLICLARGEMPGRIAREPRGQNGFGYDPLFLIPHLNQTTAQLPPEAKHTLSHRGQALRQLRTILQNFDLSALA